MAPGRGLERQTTMRNAKQRARARALQLRARWHRVIKRRQAAGRIERSRARVQRQVELSRERARAAEKRQRDQRARARVRAHQAGDKAQTARARQARRAGRMRGAASG